MRRRNTVFRLVRSFNQVRSALLIYGMLFFIDSMDRLQLARDFAGKIKSLFGRSVISVLVYGSVAKGGDTKESDIDLLVVWDGDKRIGWDKLETEAFRTLLDTKEYISLKVYTPKEYSKLKRKNNPFIKNVLSGGIQVV